MIAADTNIIIRLLTADEPQQTERARILFETETIFIPKTVLLEAELVLRRLYRIGTLPLNKALQALIALPNVRCEDEPLVLRALTWNRQGMDFADALHLVSCQVAERFVTFDRALIKQAQISGITVAEP